MHLIKDYLLPDIGGMSTLEVLKAALGAAEQVVQSLVFALLTTQHVPLVNAKDLAPYNCPSYWVCSNFHH